MTDEPRRGQTPSAYHLLSLREKQSRATSQVREPSVACPRCDVQLMPSDLMPHVEQRCSGPREPGPMSRWVSWREALMLGVQPYTLSRWANRGDVRFLGGRQDRKYLLRDIAVRMASRRR